jgi:hypothetical protein
VIFLKIKIILIFLGFWWVNFYNISTSIFLKYIFFHKKFSILNKKGQNFKKNMLLDKFDHIFLGKIKENYQNIWQKYYLTVIW